MSTQVDTILNITANVSGQQAVEAMRTGIANVATAYDRLKLIQTGLVTGFRALAAAASVGAFVELTKSTIEYGDKISLIEEKTGLTADATAKWIEKARMAGLTADDVTKAFKNLSKEMLNAMTGNEKAQAAFTALGLNWQRLKNETPNEIMLQVADAFNKMPDGIVKAGLAMEIFKKSGIDFIPVFNGGREAVENLNATATEDFTNMSHLFTVNMQEMSSGTQNLKNNMVGGLLPALLDISNTFIDMAKGETVLTKVGEILGEGLRLLSDFCIALTADLKDLLDTLGMVGAVGNDVIHAKFSDIPKVMKEWGDAIDANKASAINSIKQNHTHDTLVNPNAPDFPKSEGGGNQDANTDAIKALQAIASETKKYAEEMAKLKARNDEQKQSLIDELDALGKTKAQIENLKDARQTEKDIVEKSIGLSKDHAAAYANEARAAEKLREAMRLSNESQERTFGFGVQQWAAQYQQSVGNAAANATQLMQKSFDSMATGLANFITGAKVNWSGMVQSFLADMVKMQLEKSIFGPLAGGISGLFSGGQVAATSGPMIGQMVTPTFADGGIMTSRGPAQLRRYANGGIATGPQLAMYGEGSGPEAYVPLPDGRSIPVSMRGASGDTNMAMHFYLGDNSSSSDSNGPNQSHAQQLGALLTNTVKSVLLTEKRPGGLLSASPVGGA